MATVKANPKPHTAWNSLRGKANGNWADFSQLHSVHQGLQLFRSLHSVTRDDLDTVFTAVRSHCCRRNLRELNKLALDNLKFDHKTGLSWRLLGTFSIETRPNLP